MARSIEIVIGAKDATRKAFNALRGRFSEAQKSAIAWGAGVAGAALVAARAILSAAKRAQEFNKQLGQIATLTTIPIRTLRKEVQALAGDFGLAKDELTKGLYDALSAGVPEGNVFDFMRTASKAAIAGASDTASAVDILTTVINAFKIPASEAESVADTLFTTVRLGKTTLTELSTSLAQVAPLAAATGVQFDEIASAIATLTKQGTKTPQAVTQIRQAMIALNENLGDGWAKAMSFQDALVVLRDSAGGSDVALKKMVGRVEGVIGVLGLTGDNARGAADDLDQMTASAGAMNEAFSEMEGLNPFDRLGQQVDNVKTSFGAAVLEADDFKDSIATIGGVLNLLNNNMEKVTSSIGGFIKANRVALAVITLGATEATGALIKLFSKLDRRKAERKAGAAAVKAPAEAGRDAAREQRDTEARLTKADAFKAQQDKKEVDRKKWVEDRVRKIKDKKDKDDDAREKKKKAKQKKADEDLIKQEKKNAKDKKDILDLFDDFDEGKKQEAGVIKEIKQAKQDAVLKEQGNKNRAALKNAQDNLFALTQEGINAAKVQSDRKERMDRLKAKEDRGTTLNKRDREFMKLERAKAAVVAAEAVVAAAQEKQRLQDIKDAQTARDKMVTELGEIRKENATIMKAQ